LLVLRHHSLTSVSFQSIPYPKAHSQHSYVAHRPFLESSLNDSSRPRVPSSDSSTGENRFSAPWFNGRGERDRRKMAATVAPITDHVLLDFEVSDVFENELNDNLYNLKMSEDKPMKSNRSSKSRRILKPLLRMLKRRTSKYAKRQAAVPQVEVFYEEVENQNNANEALECRLLQELEQAEEGAAITVCLDGQMTVVPVVPGQCYVPVHFAHTHAGDFYWTTLSMADRDLCYKERAFSQHQLPEVQVA